MLELEELRLVHQDKVPAQETDHISPASVMLFWVESNVSPWSKARDGQKVVQPLGQKHTV